MASSEKLRERLTELHRSCSSRPQIVELVSPTGERLGVGLGSDETALSWTGSSLDPPYFASKGSTEDEVEPVLVFFYKGDHWTEFPRHQAIPLEQGIAAVERFFQTGTRPDNIRWQEV